MTLAPYLNDHLAGSIAAVELLESLEKMAPTANQEALVRHLRAEIEADQQTLQAIMAERGIEEQRLKQAGAWVAEKFAIAKLAMTAVSEPTLGWLMGLEILSLGIQGKAALWRALSTVVPEQPWRGHDLRALEHRAQDQFNEVERARLAAAAAAFGGDPTLA